MGILLTQGRSYRVGCHLATQARAQIALGSDGNSFLSLVSANARSVLVYPGVEYQDALYYSNQFGEAEEEVEKEIKTVKPFDPFKGSFDLNRDVTRRTELMKKTRFSPTDIRFRPFKEITHCIVSDNTLQPPGVGKIEFIPKDVNDTLDEMIEVFREENLINKEEDIATTTDIENSEEKVYDSNDITNQDSIDEDVVDIHALESMFDKDLNELEFDASTEIASEGNKNNNIEKSMIIDDLEDIQSIDDLDFLG